MKTKNVAWIAALIFVALSASLIAARIVTASTDARTAVDEPSQVSKAELLRQSSHFVRESVQEAFASTLSRLGRRTRK